MEEQKFREEKLAIGRAELKRRQEERKKNGGSADGRKKITKRKTAPLKTEVGAQYKKVESRLFKSIESTRNKENTKYVN